jgi:hypothetical protein
MENSNTIEREISTVRNEIRSEKSELNREPIGLANPVLTAEISADQRKVQRLEQKEERAKEYGQSHGFGY